MRQLLVLSVLLPLLALATGWWLAFGTGDVARHTRVDIGVEAPLAHRQFLEQTVLARSPHELEYLRDQVRAARRAGDGRAPSPYAYRQHEDWRDTQIGRAARNAEERVAAAIELEHRCLPAERQRVLALRAVVDPSVEGPADWRPRFECTEEQVALLERTVTANFIPDVAPYASPVEVGVALRILGSVFAAFAAVIMLLAAPLWAGVFVAQEVHDGTLAPLTGSALSSRQLATGMLAGPMIAIAIVSAPLFGLMLLTAVFVGKLLPALGAVVLIAIVALLLGALAQIVGLQLGQHRTPGVVGIVLLGGLGAIVAGGAG
ncbi:MAG: hypothetical protein AAF721_41175, partial [Myxococcota bacterium]